ncbi:hypothetical protein SLS53_003458 [Cytospora paraplurivora]|uniref:C2 domain-containing protein n=1 Tax=Cytospora paraplurivora TaxID=2898453 RepID=A0AAN9YIY6_9PEZI
MVKSHPLNGAHTAGILADMSIDGPEIGTLVVIVDRAKNLPNRKTIGKQDPYCAARLGKIAKKTTTDIRGGQTPKWDQELRFSVHDSPDYYQLKVSVFNDDKKTDLIGEAWIDLRDIVVPGGGQNDLWQNLSCRGKYAGEIRIEITYYDQRPKPEKPAVKSKPVAADVDPTASLRAPPKRRPLPSDPFTGQAPAQLPRPTSSHVPTPPRQQPSPPREFVPSYPTADQLQRGPQPMPPSPYSTNHTPSHSAQYSDSSLRQRQPEPYSSGPYHTPTKMIDGPRASLERHPVYPEDSMYSPDTYGHSADQRYLPSVPYGGSPNGFLPAAELDDDRPPPPPVHRNTLSGPSDVNYSPSREMTIQSQSQPAMRKEVLRNEAHRQSISSGSYPGRPVYQAYNSAPSSSAPSNDPYAGGNQQLVAHSRHHSYDPDYEAHHRSLQATVEDVPDSPSNSRRSSPRVSEQGEPQYRQDPSPAPLSLRSRGSAPVGHYSSSSLSSAHRHSGDYTRSDLSLSSRDYRPSSASQASYDTQTQNSGYTPFRPGSEQELEDTQVRAPDGSMKYALPPPVPAALIPGVDPNLSMELSHRVVKEDRRPERQYTQPPPERQSTVYSASSARGLSPAPPTMRRNSVSPAPPAIRRKSVSPAPPQDGRRLSGVPFGPDDYDALNPVLANEPPRSDFDENSGKIITYDGKQIDPSDHLPMDTWAPEPEPKNKKPETGSPTRSPTRQTMSGPQPVSSSGRRQLRIRETRPNSMMALPAPPEPPSHSASSQMGTVRNRLQKKTTRASAMPVVMSGANGSQESFAPRPVSRASTFDYDNYAPPPMYDTSPGYHARDHSTSAPPVPAKVPLNAGSGAMVPMNRNGYGDFGQQALMEEMSRIDIGTGRARRHQRLGYY